MKHSKAAIVVSTIIEKVQLISGIVILVIFGICTVMAIFDRDYNTGGFLQVCIVIDALGLWLIYLSRKRRKLITDFRKYVTALSGDPTGSIVNLASTMGTSEEVILKNLERMIQKKYFTEAYVDRNLPNRSQAAGETQNAPSLTTPPPSPGAGPQEMVTVKCGGCGGSNTLARGQSAECEYCGSVIRG